MVSEVLWVRPLREIKQFSFSGNSSYGTREEQTSVVSLRGYVDMDENHCVTNTPTSMGSQGRKLTCFFLDFYGILFFPFLRKQFLGHRFPV